MLLLHMAFNRNTIYLHPGYSPKNNKKSKTEPKGVQAPKTHRNHVKIRNLTITIR